MCARPYQSDGPLRNAVSVNLSDFLLAQLRCSAEKENRSASAQVRFILREYFRKESDSDDRSEIQSD